MASAALDLPHGLSLVTLARGERSDLAGLFRRDAVDHIDWRGDTRAARNLLAARLDAAVMRADRAVLLVAHGASCFATAWWARLSPADYVARVAGALFFRPVGGGAEDQELERSFASPRIALPFPSIVLGNDVARSAMLPQVRTLADAWGSRVIVDRPADRDRALYRTRRLIRHFTASIVEGDVRAAHRLIGR